MFMATEAKNTEETKKDAPKKGAASAGADGSSKRAASSDGRGPRGRQGGGNQRRDDRGRDGGRGRGRDGRRDDRRESSEFDNELVDVARVTRIVAGGRRFRFRVTNVLGDRKGRIGFGMAKAGDVSAAAEKSAKKAKKQMIRVPLVGEGTIPHEVHVKFKGARLFLKPAPAGTGVIAGGAVRTVLELAGVRNVHGKMHGSNTPFVNVQATVMALKQLESKASVKARRGVSVRSVVEREESAKATKEAEPKKEASAKPVKAA